MKLEVIKIKRKNYNLEKNSQKKSEIRQKKNLNFVTKTKKGQKSIFVQKFQKKI